MICCFQRREGTYCDNDSRACSKFVWNIDIHLGLARIRAKVFNFNETSCRYDGGCGSDGEEAKFEERGKHGCWVGN
jgi:hypothetical protein